MLKNYEINNETLAIIPISNKISKVIEEEEEFLISKKTFEIIDESCKFFGSSYKGRYEGTKYLTGLSYKAPIIVEETQDIIFFPTTSPRMETCYWICLNKISKYQREGHNSKVIFKNGMELILDMSYSSLENQIMRSTLLESIKRDRKKIH